ncbi:MAG: ArsR/SmtB family transcription factor [Thermoleophilia bacterium]
MQPHNDCPPSALGMTSDCREAASDCREAAEGARKALDDVLETGLFRALADPTRVAVLGALLDGDHATVSEVARCCPVDLSVVSRHLGVLRDAGVLGSEKQGREVRYRLRVSALVDTLRELADSIERCCPRGADRRSEKEEE